MPDSGNVTVVSYSIKKRICSGDGSSAFIFMDLRHLF